MLAQWNLNASVGLSAVADPDSIISKSTSGGGAIEGERRHEVTVVALEVGARMATKSARHPVSYQSRKGQLECCP